MEDIITLLKQNFTFFTDQVVKKETNQLPNRNEIKIVSKSVCQLMKFITAELERKNISYKYDYSLYISEPSTNQNSTTFKREDYALPFLHHLAIQEDDLSAENLQKYITSFLSKYKTSLSLGDIELLSSGSSRAMTNTRFAVKLLRKYQLVIDRDSEFNRSVNLSLKGILSLILLRILNDHIKDDTHLLKNEFLINLKSAFNNLDGWLIHLPSSIIIKFENIITENEDLAEIGIFQKYLQNVRKPLLGDWINFKNAIVEPLINDQGYYSSHEMLILDLRRLYKRMWSN